MRSLALLAMILLAGIPLAPTAHACGGPAPTASTGEHHVLARIVQGYGYAVQANGFTIGVDRCWWSGVHTQTYEESNGVPGLQTWGSCGADTLVLETFVTTVRGSYCII